MLVLGPRDWILKLNPEVWFQTVWSGVVGKHAGAATDEFDHLWVVEPVIARGTAASSGHGVKVGWGGVVTKCGANVENTEVALPACVHSYQVGMTFDLAESTANIVITNVDLQPWTRNSEVIQPDHELHFGTGESEWWLGTFVGPIVDGKAPNLRAEGAVEDWSWIFE